jgi:hypothetical protein
MRAAEQDRPDVAAARAEWAQNQSELDPERLVFIDETGTSTNMARQRGRSPRGERLIGKVPHGHWKTTERQAAIGRSASFGCRKAFRSVHAVALRIVHGQLPVAPCPVVSLRPRCLASVQNWTRKRGAGASYAPRRRMAVLFGLPYRGRSDSVARLEIRWSSPNSGWGTTASG